jgi:multisite-specific tRNA:(cytosine-C5)-methyltransferase
MSDTKKARISEIETASTDMDSNGDIDGEITPVALPDQDDVPSGSVSKATSIEPKGKSQPTPGGGSFKEPPYTFLPADDPMVKMCM